MHELMVTMIAGAFASSGFWTVIMYKIQKRDTEESAESQMLRGLAHDRIVYLGEQYIKRGSVKREEYHNLYDYLFVPYKKLNGNGTAERIVEQVKELPFEED